MRPVVSIIMPTRDRSSVLARALRSVVGQTFGRWELLVTDDGSTDDTREVLQAWDDPRIRILRSVQPLGAAAARNRALAVAAGEYVAFLDDDDEWLPQKLERQVGQLESSSADTGLACSAYFEVMPDGSECLRAASQLPAEPFAALARGNFLGHSTVLVRRSLLDDVGGFDEELPRLQDWDLWLRLARRCRFVHDPGPLARIHQTAGSISTNAEALVAACAHLLDKYGADDDRILAELCFATGHLLTMQALPAAGRSCLRRGLSLQPFRWRKHLMLITSLLGSQLYRRVVGMQQVA